MIRSKSPSAGKQTALRPAGTTMTMPAAATTTLLAVTGESPAVLTETVWALAQNERPPVLPARIVVVTTTAGARRLAAELHTPGQPFGGRSPWQALRDTLLASRPDADRLLVLEPPRVITGSAGRDGAARQLEDLRTREDNAAAADFILDEVRRVTANPDITLIASIAGGRKTMGALLYAALTLVGRETDRLTHVLVNAPFDQRLDPPFYFPAARPVRHMLRQRNGRDTAHSSNAARIELADVPFVPLRNAFEELRRPAGGFANLVARYRNELRELHPPTIAFDDARHALVVDGRIVRLENAGQVAILRTLLSLQEELRAAPIDFDSFAQVVRAVHGGRADLEGHDRRVAAQLAARHTRPAPPEGPPSWVGRLEGHDVTRALSILRTRGKTACPYWKVPPRSLLLPPFRLATQSAPPPGV